MPKALEDVTVLDFSHLLQGPFATQLLGDMGANIIKVERPGQGDLFRTMTFKDRWVGGTESPNFLAWNRNKRSLAIDLKAPEAQGRRSTEIAEKADIVVHNFRPGVMERLGYGYEDFRQDQPAHHLLLRLRLRRERPLCRPPRPGHADAGPDRPRSPPPAARDGPPVPVGAGFADQIGALQHRLCASSRALYWRERSGEGQKIKVDLLVGPACSTRTRSMVWVMNFGEDFERPNSVDRPSRHGGAVRHLPDQRRLGDDRDEPVQQADRRR